MNAGAKFGLAAMAAMFTGAVHAGNVTAASMDTVKSQSTPAAIAPNVSKVPAGPAPLVPIPYPSTPLDQGGDPAKKNTMPTQKPDSTFSGSTGDEAAKLKGVAAPKNKETPAVVVPSPVINLEGVDVTTRGSPTFHNAPGGAPAMSPPPAMRTPPAAAPPAVRAERAVTPRLILQPPALQRRP